MASLPSKIKNYLDKNSAKYEEIAHRTVYTAYDAASTLKKELKEVAKNLLVQADNTYALVVVPADKRIDLAKLKIALGAKKVSIPKEEVLIKILKIKPGVVSSFGKLHKVETWIDKAMLKTEQVVLSTGSATNSVLMKVKDFIQLEEAKLADIAMAGDYKLPKIIKKQMKKVKKVAKKKSAKKVVKKSIKKVAKKILKKSVKKVAKKPVKKIVKKVAKKGKKK